MKKAIDFSKQGSFAPLFASKKCCCDSSFVIEEPKEKTSCPNGECPEGCCDDTKMKIEVLGPGCAKCKATYDVVKRVVEENGIDALIVKIDDMEAIINAGIMTTPAVKVNGVVVVRGHVPTIDEIKKILGL